MSHQLYRLTLEVNDCHGESLDANESLVLDGEVLVTKPYGELDPEMVDLLERALKVRAEKASANFTLPEGVYEWTWDEALEAAGIKQNADVRQREGRYTRAHSPEYKFVCAFSSHKDGAYRYQPVIVRAANIETALLQVEQPKGESLMNIQDLSCDGAPVDLGDSDGIVIKHSSDEYQLVPVGNQTGTAGIWLQVGNLDLKVRDTGEGASVTYYPHGQDALDSLGESYCFYQEALDMGDDDLDLPEDNTPSGPRM